MANQTVKGGYVAQDAANGQQAPASVPPATSGRELTPEEQQRIFDQSAQRRQEMGVSNGQESTSGRSAATSGRELTPEEQQRIFDQSAQRREEMGVPNGQQANANSAALKANFNEGAYNADQSAKGQKFENMNFKELPPELFTAAQKLGDEITAYAKQNGVKLENTELGQMAEAVGHTQTVTRDALAATLLAESMSIENKTPIFGKPAIKAEFTNELEVDLSKSAKPGVDPSAALAEGQSVTSKDPHIVFETARRILEDARPQEVKPEDRISPDTAAGVVARHTYTLIR